MSEMEFDVDDLENVSAARTAYMKAVYLEAKDIGLTDKELQAFLREERVVFREIVARKRAEKDKKAEIQSEINLVHEKTQAELAIIQAKSQAEEAVQGGATGPKVRLPKIPCFDDKKDAMDSYLDRFERFAEACHWGTEDLVLQLSVLLTGQALDIYTRLPKADAADYEKVKKALLRHYDLTEDGYRSRFRTAKPQAREPPPQFMARLTDYLEKWIKLSPCENSEEGLIELMLMEQYLSTCSRDLAVHLKERACKTSTELVELATQYLDAHTTVNPWRRPSDSRNNNSKEPTPTKPKEENAKVTEDNKQGRKNTFVCHFCGMEGHTQRFCPKRRRGAEHASSFVSAQSRLIEFEATVAGHKVVGIRDTGCTTVIVRSDLIPENSYTGESICCTLMNGQQIRVPVARVYIDTPYYRGSVEACCLESPIADLVMGNIPEIEQRDNQDLHQDPEGTDVKAAAVETRAQQRHKPIIPLRVPVAGDLVTHEVLAQLQKEDSTLERIRDYAEEGREIVTGKDNKSKYLWKKNILYRSFSSPKVNQGKIILQVVAPSSLRAKVMSLGHEGLMAGHLGTQRTLDRVLSSFYWPGVHTDVGRFCRSCHVCQKTVNKGRIKPVPMQRMPVIDTPFKRIAVDLVGPITPMTRRKNRYILTAVDYATRYPEAIALPNIEAETVAEALVSIYSRLGIPEEVLSDQGSQFMSGVMQEVNRLLSIRRLVTTPYHPMCNGLVERFNATLKKMLMRVCEECPEEWDRYIDAVLFAYREVPNESTGFAPFELMYGRTVRGPMKILQQLWTGEETDPEVQGTYQYAIDLRHRLEKTCELAKEELEKASKSYKRYYDSKSRDRKFKVGDEVLLLRSASANKLLMQWSGPHKVVAVKSGCDYVIDLDGQTKTYHANLLKKYFRRETVGAAVMIVDDGDAGELNLPILESTESIKDVVVSDELDDKQRSEVQELLSKYQDVLTDLPGCTDLASHDVRLTTQQPIRMKQYPIPHHAKKAIEVEVAKMLAMGVIEPSSSPYCSPVVLVDKKDHTLRFCIDFRAVNKVTVFDSEPMPNPDELYARFANARYFSQYDLSKGFWQVPMTSAAKEVTAFPTDSGLYHFVRMPFGMVNACSTLNRLVRKVLQGSVNAAAFMDDMVVGTETWEGHLAALEDTFERLRKAGLTARPSKTRIGFNQIDCLGHRLGNGNLQPCEDKVDKVRDSPLPTTKKQLRSFLGLVGFYHRYVPNFSTIAAPLTDMTKKGRSNTLIFGEAELKAFHALKEALCRYPVLRLPDFDQPFIVQTDASDTGIGAILLQEHEGVKMPIAYASRKLSSAEKNYSVIERECLALIWALQKYQVYLYGKVFYLETDHKPLEFLQKARFGTNTRLGSWAMQLQRVRCYIKAVPGRNNSGADYLSRL